MTMLDDDAARALAITSLLRSFEQGGGVLVLQGILQQLAGLEAVDALTAIAQDPLTPPAIRQDVLRALTPFPTETTVALFIGELNASSRKRKQLAIDTLGRWRVHKAGPLLCAQFEAHQQTVLRGPLLGALGQIATQETLSAIRLWLGQASATQLVEDLARLASIPQLALLELLDAHRTRYIPTSENDPRVALLDQAIEQLSTTLREHQRARLAPYHQELEEVLFD